MSKRQHERRARNAEQVVGAATTAAGTAAGAAAQRAGDAVSRAGTALEVRSRSTAPVVGAAVGSAVESALEAVGTARQAAGRVGAVAADAGGEVVGVVSGIIEEPATRGLAVLEALRGVPVSPPAARRRWPWAVVAAVAGASAGAAIALLVRRIGGTDAPGAQEPHELRAVVDVPTESSATGTTAAGTGGGATPSTTPASPA